MKKYALPGILAVLFLFLPLRSQAVPLDVPYLLYVSTTLPASVVLSTTNFPSANTGTNSNVASYQWCVDRLTVSCASASNFSIFWSTNSLAAGTTDYQVTTAAGVPFDMDLSYREPYCAPIGYPVVTLKSSVVLSTVTVGAYLYKGW